MRDAKGQFTKEVQNEIEFVSNYAIMWTVDNDRNRRVGYKIDTEDLPKLLSYRWSVGTDGYAKSRKIKLHRLLLNAQLGQIVDHINGDVTDNRKINLRFVSRGLNARNTSKTKAKSGYKHILKQNKGYAVQFKCKGVHYHVGSITTLEEALDKRTSMYDECRYFEE